MFPRLLCTPGFYYRWLLFLLIFSGVPAPVKATHIVGGEMNYRYLGGSLYEIRLTVYRDCYNSTTEFDNPASIGIFDSNNNLVGSVTPFITDQQAVPNAINTPCLDPPENVCYEVAHYVFNTSLAPRPGGYVIAYQRCCRNGTIINLNNVQGTGATYFATIPDPSLATVNSNPVFNSWPPTFICQNAPFTYDHSATDPDGDSLVYEICTPFAGADVNNPMPQPPNSPPYSTVIFEPPFSLSNVFGGTPLVINPQTGLLQATPASTGQFVYGIRVKEFRNGVYIGETVRDFQVNVVPCLRITVASIFSPTIVCGSLTAEFSNTSYNAATYIWNFGDPGSSNDTSSLRDPNYTYPDTGDYTATLVAYSGIDPLCNDTAYGLVHVYPVFNTAYAVSNTRCTPDFLFTDQSYGIGGNANFWSWSFGDGSTATIQNPAHSYVQPGTYDVSLISSTDSACLDTTRGTVVVLQVPEASFNTVLDTCAQELAIQNLSQYASSYYWDFNDLQASVEEQPVHHFNGPGTFLITGIARSDSGCTDTSSVLLEVPPLPSAGFNHTVQPCDSVVSFSNSSQNGVSYFWNFGDGENSAEMSPVHNYSIAGSVPVQLIAESVHGCTDTLDQTIFFVSYKEARFDYSLDSCSGLMHFGGVTDNAVYYHWDFGDGDTSSQKNPIHLYAENGEYYVVLTVNNETSCHDSIGKMTVYESPEGEKVFIPNSFTPNADDHNDIYRISIFRPCDTYQFMVFNRWGQKVYETEDAANASWDGTFEGREVEEGVYVYILKGNETERKGAIYLVR